MVNSGSKLVLLFALSAIIVAMADGDASPTATPTVICNVSISELVQCLPAITGKHPPLPTKGCCGVMKKANLRCLCNYKSQFASFGIDPDNAVALPEKCGRHLPPKCRNKV